MKVGDKVKVTGQTSGGNVYGREGVIHSNGDPSSRAWWYVLLNGGTDKTGIYESDLTVLDNNQAINMNLKEKFVTLFISEPEKSFRKVGITNGDGILTEDGQKVFLGWLLKQNGAAFKTEVVDPMIVEEKEAA